MTETFLNRHAHYALKVNRQLWPSNPPRMGMSLGILSVKHVAMYYHMISDIVLLVTSHMFYNT